MWGKPRNCENRPANVEFKKNIEKNAQIPIVSSPIFRFSV